MAVLLYAPQALIGLIITCLILVPAVILVNLLWRICSDAGLPTTLPWAGVDSNGRGPSSRAWANLASVFNMKTLMDEGYAKYSKNNQAYVLPHILTGPEIILPLSQVRWLLEQPDSVMSQTEVNRQFLEADHTFLHPNIVREPVHPGVIRRELTHKLGSFADDIVDELNACLRENWGTSEDGDDEGWREVKVYDTMLDLISRLSTRVFVGADLCHNKEFLRSARLFDKNVVVSAAFLNLLPGFLKPVFAPIVTAYDHLPYLTYAKFVTPIIKERLKQSEAESAEKLPLFSSHGPNDYFQWAISHAKAHWDPTELSVEVIARRLACLCFAAIQSSVISITNTLYDIASSPNCAEWLDAMRQEVQAEIDDDAASSSSSSSPWTKAALARLHRVDSALRESMRLNGFVSRGIMKMVVAPEGVTLPDGSHVPNGSKIGIQAYSVHRDEEVYPDADAYQAFRFAAVKDSEASSSSYGMQTEREEVSFGRDEGAAVPISSSATTAAAGTATAPPRQPQALVSTSPTFLAFSHGPNACPGRFFAANQLKLTLAHIALHYEIEPIRERPVNKWFVGSMAPPMWETLRVRRRRV